MVLMISDLLALVLGAAGAACSGCVQQTGYTPLAGVETGSGTGGAPALPAAFTAPRVYDY
jgi:hypothetical protein